MSEFTTEQMKEMLVNWRPPTVPDVEASAPAAGSAFPSDEEIGRASRRYADDQGQVPTAVAFQAGSRWARSRWAREMQRLCSPNTPGHP